MSSVLQADWRFQYSVHVIYHSMSVGGAPLEIIKHYIQTQDQPKT